MKQNASALRVTRESKGYSLREAARQAKLSPSHYSRVERQRASLSIPAMRRLADVLDVQLAWLAQQLDRNSE